MDIVYKIDEIQEIATKVINESTSKILLFRGEMGVGKTTLIKALVKALGSDSRVSSPTFSLINEYVIDEGLVYHFDLYRIRDVEEALNFGIDDYLFSNQWVFIEWPEKIMELLPDNFNSIFINNLGNSMRSLKMNV